MTTLAQEIESKYEVLQKMGEGGMGAVYKVRHRFLDDVQVIKLMQAKFQENAELKTRFLREAKTAKQLRHPNIAEVVDYNLTSDGTAYIVMEFIEGVNLSEVLARTGGALDYRLVVTVARQALTALGFLHHKKFVHRDISPDNLMLTRDSEGNPLVKLIDLGITKSIEETRNLTMAGKFIGKVQYASPEQFGGDVDRRSDLYSLGVVLYELLTGTKPIVGSDYLNIITGHITRPPRSFDETDPNGRVPNAFRRAVLKALEKDPAHRFQTANEFADALQELDVGNYDATVEVLLPTEIATLPGEGGDAMERAEWDAASATNTIKAWESYLDRYGSSSRADRARSRLEQLELAEETDWNNAASSESSDAWRRYLEKHADAPRASMARRRLEKMQAAEMEERAWADALAAHSAPAWDLFIAAYPASSRIEEAKRLLAAARESAEEDRAWRTAVTSDSPDGWRQYLASCGGSFRAADAQSRLRSAEERVAEQQAWEHALSVDSSDAWRRFIHEHARSARAAEAKSNLARATDREAAEKREAEARRQRQLEQEAWEKALQLSSAPGWESFVRNHPQSDRLGDAMKRLAEIRESERKAAERAERERERAADDAAWNAAHTARTTQEIRAFVQAHPRSRHLGDAKTLLALLEEEKRAEERRAEEERAEAERAEKKRVEAQRAEEARAEAKRAEEKRAEAERAEKKRVEAQRAEEARAEAKRADVKRAEDERAEKKRVEEKRAEKARAEAKRAEEKRVEAERAEKKRAEEQRRLEAQMDLTAASTSLPLPVVPIALPLEHSPEPPSSASRKFSRPVVALAAAIAIIIAISAAILIMSKRHEPAAAPPPVIVETPTTIVAPVPGQGQLIIHATPWGEIRSVKNAEGEEQLSRKPLYTPITLTLPVGSYKVELTNPNSGRSATVSATVDMGRAARCEATLDPFDADEYLRRVLEPRQ